MKVVVDEMPKKASDCIFSKYEYGYMECDLSEGARCPLEYNQKCDRLLLLPAPYTEGE